MYDEKCCPDERVEIVKKEKVHVQRIRGISSIYRIDMRSGGVSWEGTAAACIGVMRLRAMEA